MKFNQCSTRTKNLEKKKDPMKNHLMRKEKVPPNVKKSRML